MHYSNKPCLTEWITFLLLYWNLFGNILLEHFASMFRSKSFFVVVFFQHFLKVMCTINWGALYKSGTAWITEKDFLKVTYNSEIFNFFPYGYWSVHISYRFLSYDILCLPRNLFIFFRFSKLLTMLLIILSYNYFNVLFQYLYLTFHS